MEKGTSLSTSISSPSATRRMRYRGSYSKLVSRTSVIVLQPRAITFQKSKWPPTLAVPRMPCNLPLKYLFVSLIFESSHLLARLNRFSANPTMMPAPPLFPAAHYTALQNHPTVHPPPRNLRNCDDELGSQLTDLTEELSDTASLKKSPSVQSSASPRSSLQRSIYLWWLEAVCCILIICGLVGIMVTLSALNNQPLPQWPYGLTVNTFVAAFSVLIKAASGLVLAEGISHIKWTALRTPQPLFKFELFDEASRGPWGALVLLWHDFGASVSSLGACIIILTLFLEPFSQQIVSFDDCKRVHEQQKGAIPRTNFYGQDIYLPFELRNMVYQGLYATVQPQAAFDCDSGNCTYSVEKHLRLLKLERLPLTCIPNRHFP